MNDTPKHIATPAVNKLQVHGACLIEVWRTSRYVAPNCFWREMQADGIMSLWRIMEPAFAKKALKAETFTLEKDGHVVLYAAKAFDVRTATLDDYARVRKLSAAFKIAADPHLMCPDCQDTKEIQATRVKIDAETKKHLGTERFVCDCPTCSSTPEAAVASAEESERAYEKRIGDERPTPAEVAELPGT